MYHDYDRAADKVIEYLIEKNYAYSVVYMNKRCFRLFKEYMAEKKAEYSQELAIFWLTEENICDLCCTTLRNYRLALFRLNDALENRQFVTIAKRPLAYQYLNKEAKDLLDTFLDEISKKYAAAYVRAICVSVIRFLLYALALKIELPTGITHKLIWNYYQDDIDRSQKSKNDSNRNVKIFLRYLVKRELIRASIVAVLNPLAIKRLFFIDELPADKKSLFLRDKYTDRMTSSDFHYMSVELDKNSMDTHQYSLTVRKVFRKTWNELFVFLEANELEYSPELALCWATYLQHYTVQWQAFRRGIRIFEQYRNNGVINPVVIYRNRKDRVQDLPEWCRNDYENFIADQHRKGFAASTLAMTRSSCLRFLEYLSRNGIAGWLQVTPERIKNFHLSDSHSTPEARNAYGAKIRKFLTYLADNDIVPSYFQLALSRECAPRVNIVPTLKEEETTAIYKFIGQTQTGYQLRQSTMILLGLRMGIRASDIVKLKFSDISWEEATISVQQDKTEKFIKLPMPTEVGNCLYRYIIQGRPSSNSKYIFISHRVPYEKIGPEACARALKQALKNDPHGFHITRKTFASHMLYSNIKPTVIAEALGHSDDSTVMKYLSTDKNSMKKCAINLKGIKVKGGMLS